MGPLARYSSKVLLVEHVDPGVTCVDHIYNGIVALVNSILGRHGRSHLVLM